ncbi:MAG TPA: DUF455 family protein [Burkholderiales bacterium]|nr:DUF455 family protein [Burkholderiales bacterium]
MPDSPSTDAAPAGAHDTGSVLDPQLFAEGPARDARYVVKERWRDCVNLPADDPLHQVEFTHRQMNEEVNGLECSARCISDFPDTPWELRMWLARQCADEARHTRMFRRLLEHLGGRVGQFPVLNFQYRIINKADTLLGRLTIQNRTFEAGGLDAVAWVAQQAQAAGDTELADFFDSQLADEIIHVRFANEWLRRMIKDNPRELLRMGATMKIAAQAFGQVMGREATEGISYPTDRSGRLEAGFTDDEVALAVELAQRAAHKERRGNGES